MSFLGACAGGYRAPSENLPDPLKLKVHSHRLENGLTLLVVENSALPIYSLYSFYKVGGKDERKGITGASHFLEHLMFKGTKNTSASRFDYLVEGNGGTSNAYTTNDFTVYHENMPSSTLELMLSVEADRMVNLVIDPKEFEQERQVVLEERKMRYENSPRGQVYLRMMEEMFRGTPYGTSVIGDVQDLKTVSRNQIYNYYRQWYAPNNATIVVVGDVKAGEVKTLVQKHFGGLKASPVPEASRAAVPDSAFKHDHEAIHQDLHGQAATPLFMLAFPGDAIGTPRGFAMDLMSKIFADGNSSYLNRKYTLAKRPRATNIYAGNYTLEKAGTFMVGGELVRGVDPAKFKEQLLKSLTQGCQAAVTETTLQKVKNQYQKELYGELDTNAGVAQFIGDRQSYFGDWAYYRREVKAYNALTVAQVKAACAEIMADKRHVWVTVWEKNPKAAAAVEKKQ
jgi:zinc protease